MLSKKIDYSYIKDHLGDELSHMIFDHWCSYSTSEQIQYLGRMLKIYPSFCSSTFKRDCFELFRLLKRQSDIISSSGPIRLVARSLPDLEHIRFLIGYGAEISEVLCLEPSLANMRQADDPLFTYCEKSYDTVLTATKNYMIPPYTELSECYFDRSLITFSSEDCFVDGGALDLYNSYRFHQKSRGRYKEILAFEPDPAAAEECRLNSSLFDGRLTFSQIALWDKPDNLLFEQKNENSHCIPTTYAGRQTHVKADTLDHLLENHNPTFLKLHLEGAELNALKGANEVIKQHHPKLAVAIGHKKRDIFDIPLEILKIDSSYELYLRHYSNSVTETVLFAI